MIVVIRICMRYLHVHVVLLLWCVLYDTGYINENGRLNMKRTEKYLEALAEVSTVQVYMLHSTCI